MGRPAKYSEERADKVCQALRLGATYRAAAGYAGVSEDTLTRWRANSAGFAENVRSSEATAAIGWLAIIQRAAQAGDWRAAAWLLARRYPHEYGPSAAFFLHHDGEVDVHDSSARDRIAGRLDELAARREAREAREHHP